MKEYKSVYTWGKRVKAVVMLSVLLIYVVSSFYMALEVEAKLIGDYEKIDNNKVMKQKIKDEVNNKTKHLKEDIEEKLNMQGIFDIEIEGLAQEDLDIINNGDNMAVATSYYYVDENNNEIECSEEQIEKLIDEIYYDGEFSRESKNGIVKKLGEKVDNCYTIYE